MPPRAAPRGQSQSLISSSPSSSVGARSRCCAAALRSAKLSGGNVGAAVELDAVPPPPEGGVAQAPPDGAAELDAAPPPPKGGVAQAPPDGAAEDPVALLPARRAAARSASRSRRFLAPSTDRRLLSRSPFQNSW